MLPLCMWLGAWQYGLFVLDKRPQIPDGHSLVIRLVQPSIPQSLKWDKDILEQNLQEYIDLSNAQDSHYIDFTVWGETASPFDLMYDYPHNRKVMNAVPRYGRLITGFLRREDNGRRVIPLDREHPEITIRRSVRQARFVRLRERNYYALLRSKLSEWTH